MSPLLFALYVNDLVKYFSTKYQGLERFYWNINKTINDNEPVNCLKLYGLLYADDIVVLTESSDELQTALVSLSEYRDENELTVNINETKVIIFSRGKLRNTPQFRYKSNIIEVVDD